MNSVHLCNFSSGWCEVTPEELQRASLFVLQPVKAVEGHQVIPKNPELPRTSFRGYIQKVCISEFVKTILNSLNIVTIIE